MNNSSHALDRQREVYIAGAAGIRQNTPFDVAALEKRAQAKMSPAAYDYIVGGAGLERTAAANRSDFDRWRIVPRMMRDVEARDTSLSFF
ncbi:MAG TPA: alpha-hydroxy-acid oxidizing protein, partial [Saprospiraceae bacterium]|nr:alpha-hydroxy-acid oxidizing protein [Saprospiraceae bacterium]